MTDDTNNENRDDTTNSTDRTGNDATVDFGDEFGVVKFADDDDSAPAISFQRIKPINCRIGQNHQPVNCQNL